MHPFRKYIVQYTPVLHTEWELIASCLVRAEYSRGDILLKSGKLCRKLYFLESGFLRFYIDKDGRDITKFFTHSPYCFTAQKSFTTDAPSDEAIEVLQDAVIWEMPKKEAFDLLVYPHWSTFIRKLIQEVQFNTEQILEDLQNLTAEERYVNMVEAGDQILIHAPLKDIASYLGIAPQSLSRIRKKYWTTSTKLT
ncbi:MAG: Crp/Fnr family transcriptional regulator [Bacteroidota bacterium]